MSKLLAMMMKPKPIMYATIKGSLTENNGVFSGFSNSNYLNLGILPITENDKYELVIKFTLPMTLTAAACTIIGSNNDGDTILVANILNSNKILRYYCVPIFSSQNGSHTLNLGNTYYLKFIYDGSSYTIYLSEDGINWEVDYTYTSSTGRNITGKTLIGRNIAVSGQYCYGSIDLNNSYIKINNTKYQLQAVPEE